MDTDSSSHEWCAEALREVHDCYYSGRLEECEFRGYDLLLKEASLSKCQKLKLLLLLTACVGDEEEANSLWTEAESLWQHLRALCLEHHDPDVDKFLASARRGLDECYKALHEEEADGTDGESSIHDLDASHAAQVDKEEGFDTGNETSPGMASSSGEDQDSGSEVIAPDSNPEIAVVVHEPTY